METEAAEDNSDRRGARGGDRGLVDAHGARRREGLLLAQEKGPPMVLLGRRMVITAWRSGRGSVLPVENAMGARF